MTLFFRRLVVIVLAILGAFTLGDVISAPFYYKDSTIGYRVVYFAFFIFTISFIAYSIVSVLIDAIDRYSNDK